MKGQIHLDQTAKIFLIIFVVVVTYFILSILITPFFVLRYLNEQCIDSCDVLLHQGLCAIYIFNCSFAFSIDCCKISDRDINACYLISWLDFAVFLFCLSHAPAALLVPLPFLRYLPIAARTQAWLCTNF